MEQQEIRLNDYYLFWRSDFSQWALSSFQDIDGTIYNCAEQYMMAKKSLLFGDNISYEKIMKSREPRIQQATGRQIQNFDQRIWDRYKLNIVWAANYLKFSQNNILKEKLLGTGSRIIAEASPTDLIWGIGFIPTDPMAQDKKKWKGKNLLGQVLMSVRDMLRVED